MSSPAWTFIPDVLDEHLDGLAFLWGERREALRSPQHTIQSFFQLEERIQAHLHGVLAAGDPALPRVAARLSSEDALDVFAAAFALLHRAEPSITDGVVDILGQAAGPRLEGLTMALSHAPLDGGIESLQPLVRSADAPIAIASAMVLWRHGALTFDPARLHGWLRHDDAGVRAAAWTLVSWLQPPLDPSLFAAGVQDAEPTVRSAALNAALWCAQPGLLTACQRMTSDPDATDPDAAWILAVLGDPRHLDTFAAMAANEAMGPQRFRIIGAYGHPALVQPILETLAHPDPETAAAAGVAFEKITGFNVESDAVADAAPPRGSADDEFEAEFVAQVNLPDPARAHTLWQHVAPSLVAGTRFCRGADMNRPLDAATFDSFDMESRRETWLRSRYLGGWSGTPLDLEFHPQRPA